MACLKYENIFSVWKCIDKVIFEIPQDTVYIRSIRTYVPIKIKYIIILHNTEKTIGPNTLGFSCIRFYDEYFKVCNVDIYVRIFISLPVHNGSFLVYAVLFSRTKLTLS